MFAALKKQLPMDATCGAPPNHSNMGNAMAPNGVAALSPRRRLYDGKRQGPPSSPSPVAEDASMANGKYPSGVSLARERGDLSVSKGTPSKSSHPMSRYHDEPEVDYDKGATDLYRRIETKDWDGAIARCDVAPHEVKTWVSRRELNDASRIRWRLLPLHATCVFRSPLSLIEALIAVYPDGSQMRDDQGMLPVHLACRNGASKGVVLTLLNSFPESIHIKDRKGRVPLNLVEASQSQNREAVIVAMKKFRQDFDAGVIQGATNKLATRSPANSSNPANGSNDGSPSANNTNGGASSGRKLSQSTAEQHEVDYEHRTVLFRHVLKKDWEGAAKRCSQYPDESATWIVTKGFNGNLRFLPLHKACVLQPPENVVESLIAAFPDGPRSRDQDGWLPIHCACFYGASEAVVSTLLVANPKGAQCKDDEGRLPLHYACLKAANAGVVNGLLGSFPKGALSKDDEGRLPIHHACSKGAPPDVVEALLRASPKGAQSKDDQGRLPLHHACRKGASEAVVKTLLKVYGRGAQVKDDQEKLPIHYAAQNGATVDVVNALLSVYPESINIKNGFGYTPLAEARAMDNAKMDGIIAALEKFKAEQDEIKAKAAESSVVMSADRSTSAPSTTDTTEVAANTSAAAAPAPAPTISKEEHEAALEAAAAKAAEAAVEAHAAQSAVLIEKLQSQVEALSTRVAALESSLEKESKRWSTELHSAVATEQLARQTQVTEYQSALREESERLQSMLKTSWNTEREQRQGQVTSIEQSIRDVSRVGRGIQEALAVEQEWRRTKEKQEEEERKKRKQEQEQAAKMASSPQQQPQQTLAAKTPSTESTPPRRNATGNTADVVPTDDEVFSSAGVELEEKDIMNPQFLDQLAAEGVSSKTMICSPTRENVAALAAATEEKKQEASELFVNAQDEEYDPDEDRRSLAASC